MKFVYVLLCAATMPLPVMADVFYEVEPDRDTKGIPYPDHLIPVGPLVLPWQRNYRRRIEDHLFQVDADIAQYLVRPSFGPESCVAIRSEVPKEFEEKSDLFTIVPQEKKKYFITVTQASESLWYSMAENMMVENIDDRKTRSVETSRIDREISLELAGAIHWAWGRMLHNTQYPATALADGKDGCTYEFSAWVSGIRSMSGETWSPEGGLTAELVALGDRISAFASEEGTSEEPLLKMLRAFEAKIPEVEATPIFVREIPEGPVDPFAAPEGNEKIGAQQGADGQPATAVTPKAE